MNSKSPLLLVIVGILAAGPVSAAKIKKCQDAQGRWHYGDTAAAACERSKIIEMSKEGNKTGEIAAPPTEAELAAHQAKKEEEARQRKLAEEQARKDQLLLATYGHENDIIYVRDRKLAQVEHTIKATQDTLVSLRKTLERQQKTKDAEESIKHTENQIAKQEAVIAARRKEQDEIKKRYEAELKRYLVVKRNQSSQTKKTPKK